jgi:hypothetical protein
MIEQIISILLRIIAVIISAVKNDLLALSEFEIVIRES